MCFISSQLERSVLYLSFSLLPPFPPYPSSSFFLLFYSRNGVGNGGHPIRTLQRMLRETKLPGINQQRVRKRERCVYSLRYCTYREDENMYCQLASEPRPSPLTWSLFTPIDSNLCSHARAVILYVGDLREKWGRPGLKHHVRRLWGDVQTPFFLYA